MSTQILNNRFEILQQLSCSDFDAVYLACDRQQSDRPTCVVTVIDYSQQEMCDRLQQEAVVLERLGQSPQVPKVLTYFSGASFPWSGVTKAGTEPASAVPSGLPPTQPPPAQSSDQSLDQSLDQSPAQLSAQSVGKAPGKASTEKAFYLVREHIVGHPISKELKGAKKLSEGYVTKLLQDTLVALVPVHKQGQVHQNLHPQNLIRQDADGQIFLSQFGALSRLSRSEIGLDGSLQVKIPVSPHPYLAPEQLKPGYADQPTPASDLYALGLIAIEALSGQPNYDLTYDPNRGLLWRDGVDVSLPLAEFIDRLVRHDHADRFADAAAALDTLRVDRNRQAVAYNSRFATVIAAPGGRAPVRPTTYHANATGSGGTSTAGASSTSASKTGGFSAPNPYLFKFFAGGLAVVIALGLGVKTYQWGQHRLSQLPATWQDWRQGAESPPAASPEELTPLLADGSILLKPTAARAFWDMVGAANAENVNLYALGGYRPEDATDDAIAAATKLNDYPTGYAVAIGGSDESQDWQPSFADSEAFKWLKSNAGTYGFELSVSERGLFGTTSPEPWHWRYVEDEQS